MTQPRIFLACPNYGGIEPETVLSLLRPSRQDGAIQFGTHIRPPNSLLARNFNEYWCEALNSQPQYGWTHFAMIHSDVDAEMGWLNILYEEMERVGADVISTALAIKDDSQETSLCLFDKASRDLDRLKMEQVWALPKTFQKSDITVDPAKVLCINTGLWLCRFTENWIKPPFHFEIKDWIIEQNGKAVATTISEDWFVSMEFARLNLKVFATSAVKAIHLGRNQWPNWQYKEKQA